MFNGHFTPKKKDFFLYKMPFRDQFHSYQTRNKGKHLKSP